MDRAGLEAIQLQRALQEHYGAGGPVFLARAPGRVNLMGDHIDYNGLPVLPIAIQREIVVAFRPRSDAVIRVANLNAEYPAGFFSLAASIPAHPEDGWIGYVKAAAQALARIGLGGGWDGVVGSTLPAAAGLSSSSALVVAAALATLGSGGAEMDPVALAALLAAGERYVGTEGGGMDQAICLGGRRHQAMRIDFQPLRLTAVPVPGEWRFVIAASGVPAHKSAAAQEAYNSRPRQCREALQRMIAGASAGARSYVTLLAHAPADGLLAEARRRLDTDLFRRFRHVVTEAARVSAAEAALRAADRRTFGRLMQESHASLRHDFEVSCAQLDTLTELALEAGADGARLTGAGFGGCVVVLCNRASADHLLAMLEERYYQPRDLLRPGVPNLFVAEPSEGARVVELAE